MMSLVGADLVVDSSVIQEGFVPVQGPDIRTYINSVEWIDNPKDKRKINVLPYKNDDLAYLQIRFNPQAIGEKLGIKIVNESIVQKELFDQIYNISNATAILIFEIDRITFSKGLDEIINLFPILTIGRAQGRFCTNPSDQLQVHLIRYIPNIMDKLGFKNGAKMQRFWFNSMANDNYTKRLYKPYIRYDDFLSSQIFSEFTDEILEEKSWINPAAKELFIGRINQKIREGKIKLPQKLDEKITFGTTKSVDSKNAKGDWVPEFETDYVNARSRESKPLTDPIDDMFCTLGSFNIHISIHGFLELNSSEQYTINIQKVGLHIMDQFEFSGDQLLGYWSTTEQDVTKFSLGYNLNYYQIGNVNYREYRERSGMGGDFALYSYPKLYNSIDSYEKNYFVDPLTGLRYLAL